jgi:hypothetical protein
MNIPLDYELELKIQENGKERETLKVYLRDPNKKERKTKEKMAKRARKMFQELNKLERKSKNIEKRIEVYEKLGKYDDLEKVLEQQTIIDDALESVLYQIEAIGGDDFYENEAKKDFETLVSGDDKSKLQDIAESKGYIEIMKYLNKAKENFLKKQFGE